MNDQAEFEKWAKDKELSVERSRIEADPQPAYAYIETEMFWECWQAAVNVRPNPLVYTVRNVPEERVFLESVEHFSSFVGYGNMMRIVSEAWFLYLEKKYGDGGGALTVGVPVAMLPESGQEMFRANVRADPLFKEDENGNA